MSRKKDKDNLKQRVVCVVTDWLTTFVAFFGFNIFRYYYMGLQNSYPNLSDFLSAPKILWEDFVVPTLLLGVYWLSGYYNRPFERSRLNELLLTFYSQIFSALFIYLGALTNDHLFRLRQNWILLLILFLFLFTVVYIGRLVVTDNMQSRRRKRKIRPRSVVVGMSEEALKVARRLTDSSNNNGSNVVAFMHFGNEKEGVENLEEFSSLPVIKDIEDLKRMAENNEIEEVILVPAPGKSPTKKVLFLLYNLYPYDISIKINPDILSIITPTIKLEDILGEPFIDLSSPNVTEFSKNVKRALDVVISAIGLVVMSPLLGLLALGVKASGPGKVIYSQQRIGKQKKPFNIYKFRSMVSDAESDGIPQLSSDDDSRITKIGKWMRKYRLDELPQFWNVLKGDMSLVGPRPEREYFIDKIVKKAPWYMLVLQVRPGITSWGMVKYGYATDIEQMIERNRYDLIYLANMSIAVDFKILIHTVKTVGAGEGK